jgi:hypothetical protein
VVLFYRQAKSLAGMTEDMREPSYALLPPGRKAQMYRDYIEMGKYALELADDAIAAIELALSSGEER